MQAYTTAARKVIGENDLGIHRHK